MAKKFTLIFVLIFTTFSIYSFKGLTSEELKTSNVSYYHDKFNGRKTASGELFQNHELTAANRSLPFGTKVKITNIKNGKSVVVRINDRGPFTKGRAFDLSKAAFAEIGNLAAGHLSVEYEVIE